MAVTHLLSLLAGYPRQGRYIQLDDEAMQKIRIFMNSRYPTECLIVKLKNKFSKQVACTSVLSQTAQIIDFGYLVRQNFPIIGETSISAKQLWYDGDVVSFTDNPTCFISSYATTPLLDTVIADIKAQYPSNELAKLLPGKVAKATPPAISADIKSLIDEFMPDINADISEADMAEINEIYDKLGDDNQLPDKSNCVVA
jgi:hypothetical protein